MPQSSFDRQPGTVVPDLATRLRDVLDQVCRCEAYWRFNDHLDAAVKRPGPRPG